LRAACSLRSQSVQLAAPVVEPRSGGGLGPGPPQIKKKNTQIQNNTTEYLNVRLGLIINKKIKKKKIKKQKNTQNHKNIKIKKKKTKQKK
ncbi:hypothetical protein, partial [Enterobacter intestinihominis]